MKIYSYDKMGAVQFANDLLVHSKPGSPLTTIIQRDMSGAFSATIVTGELLEDTVAGLEMRFSKQLTST